jgi:hypothetical protein
MKQQQEKNYTPQAALLIKTAFVAAVLAGIYFFIWS